MELVDLALELALVLLVMVFITRQVGHRVIGGTCLIVFIFVKNIYEN